MSTLLTCKNNAGAIEGLDLIPGQASVLGRLLGARDSWQEHVRGDNEAVRPILLPIKRGQRL